jgi:Bacterial Ig-like domain (group 3)/FG-GAP-like repeat
MFIRDAWPLSRKHRLEPFFGAVALALVIFAASFFPLTANAGTATATTTTLTATPSNSIAAQKIVTLTASVQSGGAPVTVGTVSFVDGKLYLGSVQVVRNASHGYVPGTATLKTALSIGKHSIVATFLPTATLASSASGSQAVTVTGTASASAGLQLEGPNASGQLTATLSASGPATPTGSVLFTNQTSNTALGTVPVDATGFSPGFSPIISFTVGLPEGVAAADVNGDGLPDMLVEVNPDFRGAGLFPYINNGNGTFTVGSPLPSGFSGGYFPLQLADYNGDGVTDVAQVLNLSGLEIGLVINSFVVSLGAGDGTFPGGETLIPAPASGNNLTLGFAGTGDFNGDGIPDLTVTDTTSATAPILYIFLGNGDGTFATPITNSGMVGVASQVVGDFNQDGFADFALTLSGQNAVFILLGKGDGTFQPPVSYPTGNGPTVGTTLQSRGNGLTDLALANQADGTLGILLGNGDGTFLTQTTYPLDSNLQVANQFVAANMTGSGFQDLVVLNIPSATSTNANAVYSLSTFAGNGDGTFKPPVPYNFDFALSSIAAADFNGDGVSDIATPDGPDYLLQIFSSGLTEAIPLTATVYGDGAQDVVATYSGDSNYSPITSNTLEVSGAGPAPPPTFTVAASPTSLTIAAGSYGTAKITVRPQNGFNGAVFFACSGLPANSTCTFSPSTVTPNAAAISTSLTVTTNVATAANRAPAEDLGEMGLSFALLLGLGSLGGIRAGGGRFSLHGTGGRWNIWVFLGSSLLLATGVSLGCGGGSGGGTTPSGPVTPAGTTTLTVTATSTGSTGTSPAATLTVIITN